MHARACGAYLLRIDDGAWDGAASTPADLVAAAQITAAGVLFDFGNGNSLLLEGLTTKAGLETDIAIF